MKTGGGRLDCRREPVRDLTGSGDQVANLKLQDARAVIGGTTTQSDRANSGYNAKHKSVLVGTQSD